MSDQKSALVRLFGVSLLWGGKYVASAYLLQYFFAFFDAALIIAMAPIARLTAISQRR